MLCVMLQYVIIAVVDLSHILHMVWILIAENLQWKSYIYEGHWSSDGNKKNILKIGIAREIYFELRINKKKKLISKQIAVGRSHFSRTCHIKKYCGKKFLLGLCSIIFFFFFFASPAMKVTEEIFWLQQW